MYCGLEGSKGGGRNQGNIQQTVLPNVHRGADKYLAVPISYFPICSTTKRILLGCVKEVRKTNS
jgi:hypothetical protein